MCVSVISITQKQITEETTNLILYTCVILKCCLKLFMKIEKIICAQVFTKEFKSITADGQNFVLVNFDVFILH